MESRKKARKTEWALNWKGQEVCSITRAEMEAIEQTSGFMALEAVDRIGNLALPEPKKRRKKRTKQKEIPYQYTWGL